MLSWLWELDKYVFIIQSKYFHRFVSVIFIFSQVINGHVFITTRIFLEYICVSFTWGDWTKWFRNNFKRVRTYFVASEQNWIKTHKSSSCQWTISVYLVQCFFNYTLISDPTVALNKDIPHIVWKHIFEIDTTV